MLNKIQLHCKICGSSSEFGITQGSKKELVARIEFLEQKVFEMAEENKDLRLLVSRVVK